ncbi:unnamed protein product [Spodoptera exigua]|nr:unnamed protein product [Spodoptera exigua]
MCSLQRSTGRPCTNLATAMLRIGTIYIIMMETINICNRHTGLSETSRAPRRRVGTALTGPHTILAQTMATLSGRLCEYISALAWLPGNNSSLLQLHDSDEVSV